MRYYVGKFICTVHGDNTVTIMVRTPDEKLIAIDRDSVYDHYDCNLKRSQPPTKAPTLNRQAT